MRTFIRSKIHKATGTDANLAYIGSITIDPDMLDQADKLHGEKVLVSGARLETHIIEGERGKAHIILVDEGNRFVRFLSEGG